MQGTALRSACPPRPALAGRLRLSRPPPMSFAHVRSWQILPFALLAGVALAPAGCGTDEGVSKVQVPKSTDASRPKVEEPAPGGDYRILGVLYPAEAPAWYFKFAG